MELVGVLANTVAIWLIDIVFTYNEINYLNYLITYALSQEQFYVFLCSLYINGLAPVRRRAFPTLFADDSHLLRSGIGAEVF